MPAGMVLSSGVEARSLSKLKIAQTSLEASQPGHQDPAKKVGLRYRRKQNKALSLTKQSYANSSTFTYRIELNRVE